MHLPVLNATIFNFQRQYKIPRFQAENWLLLASKCDDFAYNRIVAFKVTESFRVKSKLSNDAFRNFRKWFETILNIFEVESLFQKKQLLELFFSGDFQNLKKVQFFIGSRICEPNRTENRRKETNRWELYKETYPHLKYPEMFLTARSQRVLFGLQWLKN